MDRGTSLLREIADDRLSPFFLGVLTGVPESSRVKIFLRVSLRPAIGTCCALFLYVLVSLLQVLKNQQASFVVLDLY